MRSILISSAMAALMVLGAAPAQAYQQGPWCAYQSIGGGVVTMNCSMRTFEQCRQEVVAGNRGFCTPNNAWQNPWQPRRYRYYR